MPEKTESTALINPQRAAGGMVIFAALSAALLLAAAVMISREILPENIGRVYVIIAMVAASTASGGFIASGLSSRKAIAAAINTAEAEALLLTLGLIFAENGLSAGDVLCQLACIAAGSITGCVVSAKRGHTGR